jgi:RNA-splicing ligase RtcB
VAAAIPVGVGSEGSLLLRGTEMDKLLSRGMPFTQELGLSWPEDREVTEEQVCVCVEGGEGTLLMRHDLVVWPPKLTTCA